MYPTLTHVALHVRDLEACVAFYSEVCGMRVVHERPGEAAGERIVWMSEPGRERAFVFVLLPGGPGRERRRGDVSHLGFAVDSRAAVDAKAEQGRAAGRLLFAPVDEGYPVGYFCCLVDPDGNVVEFSYGQPLGPGAEDHDAETLA